MLEDSFDERLVLKKVAKGDAIFFRKLYDHYRNIIYAYALKLTKSEFSAEEIVQEVFIKIWINHHKINPDLPLKPYLYKITKNHVLNFLRKAANDINLRKKVFYNFEEAANCTEDIVIYNDYEKCALEGVSKLSQRKQEIFQLSRAEGKTNDEIAERLGISKSTVKDQLLKATKSIKSYLKIKADITLGWFL